MTARTTCLLPRPIELEALSKLTLSERASRDSPAFGGYKPNACLFRLPALQRPSKPWGALSMRYYDPIDGRMRIKRRYVWGFWSFFAGSFAGAAVLAAAITLLR